MGDGNAHDIPHVHEEWLKEDRKERKTWPNIWELFYSLLLRDSCAWEGREN